MNFSCSVNCFKDHECKPITEEQCRPDPNAVQDIDGNSYLIEIPEEYLLPKATLEKLKDSVELKKLLENPHLREFLKHAHETYNPAGFLKLAMQEPLFVEFSDACLKSIHPEEYNKEYSDQELIEHFQEVIENQNDQ